MFNNLSHRIYGIITTRSFLEAKLVGYVGGIMYRTVKYAAGTRFNATVSVAQ